MSKEASSRQEAQVAIEPLAQAAHPEQAGREISEDERHTFLDWLVIWSRQTDAGNEGGTSMNLLMLTVTCFPRGVDALIKTLLAELQRHHSPACFVKCGLLRKSWDGYVVLGSSDAFPREFLELLQLHEEIRGYLLLVNDDLTVAQRRLSQQKEARA